MRVLCQLSMAIALVWTGAPATAGSPDPNIKLPPHADSPTSSQCEDTSASDDARIASCTSVITSRQRQSAPLADIYLSRCNALISRALRARYQKDGSTSLAPGRNLDQALKDCSQAIALNPTDGRAYSSRAEIYDIRRDWDHAIPDYDQAIRLKPIAKGALDLVFRGTDYANKGDYDRAISDCSRAQSLGGEMLGGFDELCLENARGSKARVAAGQTPRNMRAWCRGKALIQEGDPRELVIPGCTALIKSGKEKPGDLAEAFYNRAHARYSEADADKNLADYGAAIRYRPRYADAYGWRGITYYWPKADYDRAIADLTMALRLKPNDRLYLSYRGKALIAKGSFAVASKDFARIIALDPGNAEAFLRLSDAKIGLHDYAGAIVDADQAIKLSPLSGATEAYNNRGDAHFHLGALAEAMADYDAALKLYPDNWQSLYGRGVVKLRVGDTAGGRTDIDAAVKLHPGVADEERKRGIAM